MPLGQLVRNHGRAIGLLAGGTVLLGLGLKEVYQDPSVQTGLQAAHDVLVAGVAYAFANFSLQNARLRQQSERFGAEVQVLEEVTRPIRAEEFQFVYNIPPRP